MGRKLNLSHLTDEECEQVLKVIQRDFGLRQQERERLERIQEEIQEDIKCAEVLDKIPEFSELYCLRCRKKFTFLLNPKVLCAGCRYNVCKKCAPYNDVLKQHACRICLKQSGLLKQSNSWFYTNVRDRFKRFGSAKVVRSLHDRRTSLSDADSDLGYQPSFRSLDLKTMPTSLPVLESSAAKEVNEQNGEEPSDMMKWKMKLEAIVHIVHKSRVSNSSESSSAASDSKEPHTSSLIQQVQDVRSLLTSMAVSIASDLNEHCDQSEQTNEVLLRVLRERVRQLCALVFVGDQPASELLVADGVSTVEEFITQTSRSIVAKVYADARASGEDDEGFRDQRKAGEDSVDCGYQLMAEAADRGFDVDKADTFAFATRHRYKSSLPDLSVHSSDVDSDLDVVSNRSMHDSATDTGSNPWILEQKVTVPLKRRIPYSHRDGYKSLKQSMGDDMQAAPLFLPPPSDTSEGPMIGDREASELSSDSDTVLDEDEDGKQQHLSEKADSGVQTDGSPPRMSFHGPWFVRPPADATVPRGAVLHCDCVVGGTLPIDVFWYHDARQLDDDAGIRCSISQNAAGSSSVTLSDVMPEDAGTYVCVAVNKYATCRQVFQINVTEPTTQRKVSITVHTTKELPSLNNSLLPDVTAVGWPESGETVNINLNHKAEETRLSSTLRSELEQSSHGKEDTSSQLPKQLALHQTSYGAKRLKAMAENFTADIERAEKPSADSLASQTAQQLHTAKDASLSFVTSQKELPPVRSGLTNHSNTSTSISKDDLQDTYDEFERVYEANMLGRKTSTLHEPPGTFTVNVPIDDMSIAVDGNEGLINCGPRRVDVTRYKRDFVVSGENNDIGTSSRRQNVAAHGSRNSSINSDSYRSRSSSIQSDDARSDHRTTDEEEMNTAGMSPQKELELLPLPSVRNLKEKFATMEANTGDSNFQRVSSLTARHPPVSVTVRREFLRSQMSEEMSAEKMADWRTRPLPVTDQKYTGESLVHQKKPALIQVSPPPISPPKSSSHPPSRANSTTSP